MDDDDDFDVDFFSPGEEMEEESGAVVKEEEEQEKSENGNEVTLPRLVDVNERRRQLVEEEQRLDAVAEQLRLALSLRSAMEQCASQRTDPPLRLSIEPRFLSSGEILLLLHLKNEGDKRLEGWTLVCTIDGMHGEEVLTRSLALPSLRAGDRYSGELLVDGVEEEVVPRLLSCQLVCCMDLGGEQSAAVRVPLGCRLVSSWDAIEPTGDGEPELSLVNKSGRRVEEATTSIPLPLSLVDCLCGCPDDDDCGRMLRLVLPQMGWKEEGEKRTSVEGVLRRSLRERVSLCVSVHKRDSVCELRLSMRDAAKREAMADEMRIHLSLLASQIQRRPIGRDNQVASIPSFTSPSDLLQSLTANFK